MFNTNSVKTKMTAVVDHFKDEMKKVRTGRAHPDMLTNVKAEVYGQMSPLNQIANVTVQGATMLLITPYDVANIGKITAAIRADQSLGVKTASGKVEEAKIALRKLRDDARKDIKAAELAEDAKKRAEKEVDEITKGFNVEIDQIFAEKEADIMKI